MTAGLQSGQRLIYTLTSYDARAYTFGMFSILALHGITETMAPSACLFQPPPSGLVGTAAVSLEVDAMTMRYK